jgi:hypothetical protein
MMTKQGELLSSRLMFGVSAFIIASVCFLYDPAYEMITEPVIQGLKQIF